MGKLRLRDVPLRKRSETERDINRDRFVAYMSHLGVEIEWVKRDTTIASDGSRQCVVCLVHKSAESFTKKNQPVSKGLVPTCSSCRELHGWSGYNRGNSNDARNLKKAAK